jgi:hypothetical protein
VLGHADDLPISCGSNEGEALQVILSALVAALLLISAWPVAAQIKGAVAVAGGQVEGRLNAAVDDGVILANPASGLERSPPTQEATPASC